MRTRLFVITILLLASLLACSIPAICEDAPVSGTPAPDVTLAEPGAAPAATVEPAKPDEPAPTTVTPVVSVTPVVAVQPVSAPEIPTVTPDTNIFKRTPKIDGAVEDGEWDTYYTYKSGDWEITTYANWDSANLYIAAKSNKPIDLLGLLDANADGWYNGEDNYEFRAVRGAGDSLKLDVNRYDSRRTKSPAASPVTEAETALVEMKSGVADGMTSIEIRIPADLVRKFKLGDGRKTGLLLSARTGSNEASWIGSGSPGDTKESILVSKKIASLKPLDLGFDLRDAKIARGEELVGKLHLANLGAETVDVRSFVVAGEGKAGEYLSSEKVRLEGLAPKKHIGHDIKSVIPVDMPLGSWAIGAEVRSGDSKLGAALVSFEVVEPFEIALRLPNESVKTTIKDITVGIVITNNMRRSLRGQTQITLPAGWELWKDNNKRDFSVTGESLTTVTFKMKPPLGVLGEIPIKVDVTINGKTVTTEGKFMMVNP